MGLRTGTQYVFIPACVSRLPVALLRVAGDFFFSAPPRIPSHFRIPGLRTRSKRELDNLVDAVSGMVDEEAFLKVWEECFRGGDPHTALLIDKHPKQNHPSPFRRGLDTFLILE